MRVAAVPLNTDGNIYNLDEDLRWWFTPLLVRCCSASRLAGFAVAYCTDTRVSMTRSQPTERFGDAPRFDLDFIVGQVLRTKPAGCTVFTVFAGFLCWLSRTCFSLPTLLLSIQHFKREAPTARNTLEICII